VPLTARAFARALGRLGPFEPEPPLAVAVSGGADSMALALLADRWARAQGGRVTAVTVDHGLRPGSAAEARQVRGLLAAYGIPHVTLRWRGAKPATGIQAQARAARYALLEDWCRDHAVLHLLVAHHRGDQAETVAMRRAMQSGPDGLAGMAPVAWRRHVRVLRPLLDAAPEDIRAWLARRGVAWIEDPSNSDDRFTRVRVRRAMTPARRDRLAAAAARAARTRAVRDAACARLLARCVRLGPDGQGALDPALFAARRGDALRALARIVACVGGRDYAPRRVALERAFGALKSGRAATLGGCWLRPQGGEVRIRPEKPRRGVQPQAARGPGSTSPDCNSAMTRGDLLSGRNLLETASFRRSQDGFASRRAMFAAPFPVV
jgi:tRNA(Ile)-lysidine synthase